MRAAFRSPHEPVTDHEGESATGIAAIKVALNDLLDDRPEEAVLSLEAALVLGQEALKMMEQHPVENRALRMSKKRRP